MLYKLNKKKTQFEEEVTTPKRKFAYCVSTESTKAHDEMIKEGVGHCLGKFDPSPICSSNTNHYIIFMEAIICVNNKGPGEEFQ
jgi:hypothetical protein